MVKPQLLLLACALAACAPQTVVLELQRRTCDGTDLLAGATRLELYLRDANGNEERHETVVLGAERELRLPKLPLSEQRSIIVDAYREGVRVASAYAPLRVPAGSDEVTIRVWLRRAGAFDTVSTQAACARMAEVRSGHTATLLPDGRVFIAGGFGATGDAIQTAEIFDPQSGSSIPVAAPMPLPRANHVAALLPMTSEAPQGAVLLAGGDGDAAATVDVFRVHDATWLPAATLRHPRRHAASVPGFADFPLLLGGLTNVENALQENAEQLRYLDGIGLQTDDSGLAALGAGAVAARLPGSLSFVAGAGFEPGSATPVRPLYLFEFDEELRLTSRRHELKLSSSRGGVGLGLVSDFAYVVVGGGRGLDGLLPAGLSNEIDAFDAKGAAATVTVPNGLEPRALPLVANSSDGYPIFVSGVGDGVTRSVLRQALEVRGEVAGRDTHVTVLAPVTTRFGHLFGAAVGLHGGAVAVFGGYDSFDDYSSEPPQPSDSIEMFYSAR